MIRTDGAPNFAELTSVDALSPAATGLDADRPQPFSDFSNFQGADQVSAGRTLASADPVHAARAVAAFLLKA